MKDLFGWNIEGPTFVSFQHICSFSIRFQVRACCHASASGSQASSHWQFGGAFRARPSRLDSSIRFSLTQPMYRFPVNMQSSREPLFPRSDLPGPVLCSRFVQIAHFLTRPRSRRGDRRHVCGDSPCSAALYSLQREFCYAVLFLHFADLLVRASPT